MKNLITLISLLVVFVFCFSSAHSQAKKVDENNPKNFQYFRIDASTEDDTIFVIVQKEMGVDPMFTRFRLIVNVTDPDLINHYVIIGEETDPMKVQTSWSSIDPDTRRKILNWSAPNKINLAQRTYGFDDPFTDSYRYVKVSDWFSPAKKYSEIKGRLNYINPYFQLFGGERIGAPLKSSVGLSFGTGTKYSGPFESDQISAGLHVYGVSVNYITRLQGLNSQTLDAEGDGSPFWSEFNNIYSPPNAWEINIVFPFGNFFEFGFYRPFGDIKKGGPPWNTYYENNDTAKPMPNNIVGGDYFNCEFRYPFRFFSAERSQVYLSYYLKEVHLGFFTRASRLAGTVFDLRMDYTFTDMRNNQFLLELLMSNFFESFGFGSIALGPSFRIAKLESGNIGLHTFFLNARFKLGDFYDFK
jgi:hypothetical protein